MLSHIVRVIRKNTRVSVLAVFGMTVLATIVNVACSNVEDVDNGTSDIVGGYGHPYSHPYGSYGYGAAHNVAPDYSAH